jgi:hypothetical protein
MLGMELVKSYNGVGIVKSLGRKTMSNDVWIGALISVPIGIATGIAITPIQRYTTLVAKQKQSLR